MGSHAELLARHRGVMPTWLASYDAEPIQGVGGSALRRTGSSAR